MTKIVREVAEQEVNRWLDHKKIGEKKREGNKESVETIIEAIVEGVLALSEEHVFIHTLKHPTTGDAPVTKLEYQPRVKMSVIHAKLQGTKSGDGDARVLAYIAALTSQTKALIQSLDTEDYSISQSIAIFFL